MTILPLFQVYGLYDPRSDELCYVGETTMSLRRRQRSHIDSTRNPHARDFNYARRDWIRSLLQEGFEPEIRLIEEVSSADEMHERERYWIAFYTAQGVQLTNLTSGGSGAKPGSAGAKAIGDKAGKTYEGFIDPDGNPLTITNMKRFCDKHGLVRKSMMDVYHGRKMHHHRYGHVSTAGQAPKNIKLWSGFIRPDGTQEPPFWGLNEFCVKHNLNRARIREVIMGVHRQHHGWRWEEPNVRSLD